MHAICVRTCARESTGYTDQQLHIGRYRRAVIIRGQLSTTTRRRWFFAVGAFAHSLGYILLGGG